MADAAAPLTPSPHEPSTRTRTPARTRRLDVIALISIPVLAALVVWLNSTLHVMEQAQFFIGNQPGNVLYAATFEQFTEDWQQYGGRLSAQVADGALTLTVDQHDSGAFSAAQPGFHDYDLRVVARAVAASPDNPLDNAFGVVFGLQAGDPDQLADDRYHLFQISSDGYYRLARVQGGVFTEVSTWIDSPIVRTGLDVENTLRVAVMGDRLRLWVNDQPAPLCIPNNPDAQSTYLMDACIDGQMVEVLENASVGSGQIALSASSTATGGAGVQVRFDDLVILGVEESVLAVPATPALP